MKANKSGFTLVEVLVVLIVIGILVSLILVSYGNIQAKSRDTKRISDLQHMAEAIGAYEVKFGNPIGATSNCGKYGEGWGWFNYTGASYPNTILSCLTSKGYLDDSFIEPFNCTSTSAPAPVCQRQGYAYMKYSSLDEKVTCVYARLETNGATPQDLIDSNPCSLARSDEAASYGMNYGVLVK